MPTEGPLETPALLPGGCARDLQFRRDEEIAAEVWRVAALAGTDMLYAFTDLCLIAKERRQKHWKSCDTCRGQQ
jgi:hypothetical protein